MKLKKGDNVIILAGKDRGKTGTIFRAFPKTGKIVVEGINVMKRHQGSRRTRSVGQIIEKPMPIDVSNVALKDKSGKPSRVGYKTEDGKKVRIMKKGGAAA